MEKNNLSRIVGSFLAGRFSDTTEERVQRWLIDKKNEEAKEKASLAYWNELRTEINADTYTALKRVNRRIGYSKRPVEKTLLHRRTTAIAAIWLSLFLIAGGYLYYHSARPEFIETTVAYGETKHIRLPDSSEVWANAGTRVKYPKKFNGKCRAVQLDGEAYFSVKPDRTKPFIVQTRSLSVKVLGTKFNVKAYPGDQKTETTLTSGKVEVHTSSAGIHVLKPNERLIYRPDASTLRIARVSPAETDSWLKGELLFRDASFDEILRTLERRFDVAIVNNTDIPASTSYTVKFVKKEGIDEILNVLEELAGFSFSRQADKIILRKK